jgi:NADH:ubiquinone oxidoreductase subunit 6 (subunit J)
MTIVNVIFLFLAVLVLVPALLVVTTRNIFHSALWLVVSLSAVSGLYAMLAADFLFAVQLLVYVGGVMILMLFGILLSGKPSDWAGSQVNDKAWAAALLSALVGAALIGAVQGWPAMTVVQDPLVTTGRLGQLLVTGMLLPFEVISLVLVSALVGAIYFSLKRKAA